MPQHCPSDLLLWWILGSRACRPQRGGVLRRLCRAVLSRCVLSRSEGGSTPASTTLLLSSTLPTTRPGSWLSDRLLETRPRGAATQTSCDGLLLCRRCIACTRSGRACSWLLAPWFVATLQYQTSRGCGFSRKGSRASTTTARSPAIVSDFDLLPSIFVRARRSKAGVWILRMAWPAGGATS